MTYVMNDIWPSKSPTAKQYAYAWSMAHTLNKELPPVLDITNFSIFIERNKEEFEKACARIVEEKERIILEENMRSIDFS